MRFSLPTDFDNDEYNRVDSLTSVLKDLNINQRFALITEEAPEFELGFKTRGGITKTVPYLSSDFGEYKISIPSPLISTNRSNVIKFNEMLLRNEKSFTNKQVNTIQLDLANSRREIEHEKSISKFNETTIVHSIEATFEKRNEEVKHILKQECERKKKEEAERKRIEEAERKRKEEEERQKREAIERQKKEEELRIKKENEEEERKAKEKALRAAEEARLKEEREKEELKKGKGVTKFSEVEKEYTEQKSAISAIKSDVVEAVKKDPDLKKAIFNFKRQINPKFGQLTSSLPQLNRITSQIVSHVETSKENDLAYKWILNFIAKAIVAQAETEVTVSSKASLPLARLAISLTMSFPELKYFLTARFVKKCPFVIGYTCQIDTEEGRLRMGWKRTNDKWEEETRYNERMGGITTLFAVMTRLRMTGPDENNKKYPYPISLSWKFLARMLNTPLDLLTNAHFNCVANWWDAAAVEFLQAYGIQGQKLLKTVCVDWTQAVAHKKFTGAARLRILGDFWIQNNKIESFKEMDTRDD